MNHVPPPLSGADPRRFQGDLQAVCGAFHVHPAAHHTGSVTTGRLGGLDLVRVATNARAIERGARDAARDHMPHYFLIRQLAGSARMEQRGQHVELAAGDFFLASSTRPALFRYGESSLQASLHLPRPPLAEAFGRMAGAGLHLPGQSVMGRAVARALARLSSQPDELADLLAIAVKNTDAPELALIAAAQDLIARRASDPSLTPATLSAMLGVSLRQLQRAFSAEAATASGAIAARRMATVCALLRARPDLTVTACAGQAGFPDISRFTRDFRAAHGCTPGQYRRGTTQPTAAL
ncbi:helix-turn-helix domain-containing protein [Paracoccus aurantiacus]|uniref:Helix-turn-helix domain-containing protein n=1 Tax=Paracoccus aurantiacus TaxID=2599412 RepID=A0A5C6RZN1_9RHOB|nr:helix-turn-helix domain-containing protein [Paracoccus aurantiacus]TXB67751.1 helix-turn-helix domain-containing protein [Paracoccus aurantiacus]